MCAVSFVSNNVCVLPHWQTILTDMTNTMVEPPIVIEPSWPIQPNTKNWKNTPITDECHNKACGLCQMRTPYLDHCLFHPYSYGQTGHHRENDQRRQDYQHGNNVPPKCTDQPCMCRHQLLPKNKDSAQQNRRGRTNPTNGCSNTSNRPGHEVGKPLFAVGLRLGGL